MKAARLERTPSWSCAQIEPLMIRSKMYTAALSKSQATAATVLSIPRLIFFMAMVNILTNASGQAMHSSTGQVSSCCPTAATGETSSKLITMSINTLRILLFILVYFSEIPIRYF